MVERFVHQNSGQTKRGTSPTSPGGLIESTKRAVMSSLMRAFQNSEDEFLKRVAGNVQMNYPQKESEYPGIWVGFSLTDIQRASIDPIHETENDQHYMLGRFEGSVSLNVLSMSSVERDRISDALVQTLLFGRSHAVASTFFDSLTNNDYVNITVNDGTVRPSGQSETMGTPWGSAELVYEDTYSFSILGQFASRYEDYGFVRLSEIRIVSIDKTLEGYSDDLGDTGEGVPAGEWV